MSVKIEPGYSIRRIGDCNEDETQTAGANEYVVCCPKGHELSLQQRSSDLNWLCLTSETQSFNKVCANSTWDLWYAEGFLCCEPGMIGYLSKDSGGDIRKSTFGCNTDAYIKNNGTKLNIERGTRSTPDYPDSGNSTTNNSTTKTSNNGTPNGANMLSNNDPNDGPNKGAIAGGVVGGVCGILIIAVVIFLLLRRRRRSKISSNSKSHTGSEFEQSPAEVEGEGRPLGELNDTASKRNELEADKVSRQELAASGHAFKKTNEVPPSELA